MTPGGASPTPARTESALPTETPPLQTDEAPGPLFVNPDNTRYFTDGTKVHGKYRVVYLTGLHTWCNFMDCGNSSPPIPFNYTQFLDFLQEHNLNFFRLWRAENARGGEAGPDFWFSPMPYERSETECCAYDGGNKFDLTMLNQAYFDRMRERVIQAGDRGIYVSIMLFDGWSVDSKFTAHVPWVGHPYNIVNNLNNIDGDLNHNGQGEETHKLIGTDVTALQEVYVRKVIDTVNDLDNVLYEISNESPGDNPGTEQVDGSRDWQYHMINLIRDYEAGKPKQHPIGMTWEWPYGNNEYLYESPADWISLGGNLDLTVYSPPATTGAPDSKVVLADTDHLCGICGSQQWVWKSFTRGENPIFMDIYDQDVSGRGNPFHNPNEIEIRRNLTYTRMFAEKMNLIEMSPRQDLCSTEYCLANVVPDGAEYLVFVPSVESDGILNQIGIGPQSPNSKVVVDLTGTPVELQVEWFNPDEGTYIDGGVIHGGASQTFMSPFGGDAILYIHDL